MQRWWVSWWSGYYADEGCTEPPFQVWISGYRDRDNAPEHCPTCGLDTKRDRDECSICAVIDAESEKQIWEVVAKHFPDYEERFCTPKEQDFEPGDRFPGFESKTSLTGE